MRRGTKPLPKGPFAKKPNQCRHEAIDGINCPTCGHQLLAKDRVKVVLDALLAGLRPTQIEYEFAKRWKLTERMIRKHLEVANARLREMGQNIDRVPIRGQVMARMEDLYARAKQDADNGKDPVGNRRIMMQASHLQLMVSGGYEKAHIDVTSGGQQIAASPEQATALLIQNYRTTHRAVMDAQVIETPEQQSLPAPIPINGKP